MSLHFCTLLKVGAPRPGNRWSPGQGPAHRGLSVHWLCRPIWWYITKSNTLDRGHNQHTGSLVCWVRPDEVRRPSRSLRLHWPDTPLPPSQESKSKPAWHLRAVVRVSAILEGPKGLRAAVTSVYLPSLTPQRPGRCRRMTADSRRLHREGSPGPSHGVRQVSPLGQETRA